MEQLFNDLISQYSTQINTNETEITTTTSSSNLNCLPLREHKLLSDIILNNQKYKKQNISVNNQPIYETVKTQTQLSSKKTVFDLIDQENNRHSSKQKSSS